MEKTSTRTPKIRAATKCPHSCTRIITPSTSATPNNKYISIEFPFSDLRSRCGRDRQPLYFFLGHSTRFGIRGKHIVHGQKTHLGCPRQHPLDHFRNSQKRQFALEKRGHPNFIRGVQCTRKRPAPLQC